MSLVESKGATVLELPSGRLRMLTAAPLIAPARQLVFPIRVPGEEEALNRGSVFVEVSPALGGSFLAQCAIGFQGTGVAQGFWPAPDQNAALVGAGGYVYRMDPNSPEHTALLPLRPVVGIVPSTSSRHVVLVGFHHLLILDPDGEQWQSERMSWEGVAITSIKDSMVCGTGWDMLTDEDVPFTLDLNRRVLTGGGYRQTIR